ncbi:MAG: hypothetical protein LC624_07890 [Halobacteriales archaeon]|nr:hypothetical protein [Halobacteriales archaeon]
MRRALVLLSLAALLLVPPAMADISQVLADGIASIAHSALPDQGDAMLLLGSGQAYTYRNGHGVQCAGPSQLVIEASHKSFGQEPTVTIAYGGARSDDQGLALSCGMGQLRQPLTSEIQGTLAGAWTAERTVNGEVWHVTVGAPDASGQRAVRYTLHTLQGVLEDSFQGTGSDDR